MRNTPARAMRSRRLNASGIRSTISTFWSEIRPHPGLKMAISWVACDDAVVMASPATSPAQYPAASGVGVSVLLRQPHGFEGLGPRAEAGPPDDLAAAEPG